jgi:two-component system cell cycle sensor histidine kinase/response regulator CckA
LVVDDDESVRELMAMVLEAEGYNVFRARNSREALFLNEEFAGTFHLLLTDICMKPHPDGFALAGTVRRSRPDIRVIYVSGFVEQDRLISEMEERPSLFLPKPFSPPALLECVRRALAVSAPV